MKPTPDFDPQTYIRLIQLLLMGLEDILTPEDLNEDARSADLSKKLQSYRAKVEKIKSVVAKHREADQRKRELAKSNHQQIRKSA